MTVAVAVASAIDAAFPQPAPGSHWLPVRKVISFIAINFGAAKNGSQPPFATWLLRVMSSVEDAARVAGDSARVSEAVELKRRIERLTPPSPAPVPAAPPSPAPVA
ncbi:hypothetical protein [Acidocella aminolytica]|uniref:hypothetical protein n=1 Tax=Acidocella aminolytica TaxID=33998 RepID=UPI001114799B|nr:hypothetical protein [Acidocella aminolytica]